MQKAYITKFELHQPGLTCWLDLWCERLAPVICCLWMPSHCMVCATLAVYETRPCCDRSHFISAAVTRNCAHWMSKNAMTPAYREAAYDGLPVLGTVCEAPAVFRTTLGIPPRTASATWVDVPPTRSAVLHVPTAYKDTKHEPPSASMIHKVHIQSYGGNGRAMLCLHVV